MTVCPICRGPKSRRAQMCVHCRRAANTAGENLLLAGPGPLPAPLEQTLRTPIQNRVYHGKLADLVKRAGITPSEAKREALARASAIAERPIESSTELSEIEMERLLEWLTDRLDALPPSDVERR